MKTSPKFCFLMAEHSTSENARILVFIFFPSANVTNLGESGILRSDLVPERIDER